MKPSQSHLSRQVFEFGMVRLQFLNTLHEIAEDKISREATPEKPAEQTQQMEESGETLVVTAARFLSSGSRISSTRDTSPIMDLSAPEHPM